jgi:hypothetical protein
MWIKKSEDQFQKEKKEIVKKLKKGRFLLSIKLGLAGFIVVYLFDLITALTIGINYSKLYPVTPEVIRLDEIPKYNYEFLNSGIFVGVALFFLGLALPSILSRKNDSMKCDKCFMVKNPDNKNNCRCGGTFFHIDYFEWINDDVKLNF